MSLKNKLSLFFSNRTNLGLIVVLLLLLIGGFFGFKVLTGNKVQQAPLEEVDLPFDPEGPYALLYPRRDGNALILNIRRVLSYESVSYELTYQSNGIDRGVQGKLNTNNKKNEYSQEILFGTCSTVNTYSIKNCVFDPNVENGTLLLKIQKGNKIYRMVTQWRFQRPDVALGVITSGDGNFIYKTTLLTDAGKTSTSSNLDLARIGYSIVNDLSGAPKLPNGKKVQGKVYGFNIPETKVYPEGDVTIVTIDNLPSDAKLARYDEGKNQWDILDSKVEGSKISAKAKSSGVFTVLVNNSTNKN